MFGTMQELSERKMWGQIPGTFSAGDVLRLVHGDQIDSSYLILLKELSHFSDQAISDFLHINVKTYRNYRDAGQALRRDIQEHTIMILSLIKHGMEVFGDSNRFSQWLSSENFHFGNQRPSTYLDTISGIKLLDDRLTAMEYGDNV